MSETVLRLNDFTVYLVNNLRDKKLFNQLIIHYHYLHSLPVGGKTIKLVAKCSICDRWFALLEFRSSPLGSILYLKKHGYEINDQSEVLINTRFLILTDYQLENECHKNIKGSRILSKALTLLKQLDKSVRYVISYVDINRGYLGTVYKASNFKLVGYSKGVNIKRPFKGNTRKWRIKKVPQKLLFMYQLR